MTAPVKKITYLRVEWTDYDTHLPGQTDWGYHLRMGEIDTDDPIVLWEEWEDA